MINITRKLLLSDVCCRYVTCGVVLLLAAAGCSSEWEGTSVEPAGSEVVEEPPFAQTESDLHYNSSSYLDYLLRWRLEYNGVKPVEPPAQQDPALVELGRNLFFEREIAGPRNIACSTCHNPTLGSADAQSQSRGQGAVGLGPSRRQDGDEFFEFLPRNALSLWNRGVPEWKTMFWDGRLGEDEQGTFFSPAGDDTPQDVSNALALFSIIPVTPDQEMRGFPGQLDRFGEINEMSELTNDDFPIIWDLVVQRVLATEGYDQLLRDAFPNKSESEIGISELVNAMGAFQTEAFTALDTPFDRYLAGDNSAMSDNAKRGANLFYGRANCASCHSGGILSDQDFHNIAAPQVGTGRGETADIGLDLGRGAITGNAEENFRFRTPPLRNIELESPYFHNGAYDLLEDAIRHHLDPATALANYDDNQVEEALRGNFRTEVNGELLSTIDPALAVSGRPLNEYEIGYLMDFMAALTDRASLNLLRLVPDNLPSGLPLAEN